MAHGKSDPGKVYKQNVNDTAHLDNKVHPLHVIRHHLTQIQQSILRTENSDMLAEFIVIMNTAVLVCDEMIVDYDNTHSEV